MQLAIVMSLTGMYFTYKNVSYCYSGYAEVDQACLSEPKGDEFEYCAEYEEVTKERIDFTTYLVRDENAKSKYEKFCELCPLSTYPTENSTCITLTGTETIMYCDLYDVEGACVKCANELVLVESGSTLACVEKATNFKPIPSCTTYTSNELVCKRCVHGWRLEKDESSNLMECEIVENCDENVGEFGACSKCKDGYVYHTTLKSCILGCNTDEIFVCNECVKRMKYRDCATYNDTSCSQDCASCKEGFYLQVTTENEGASIESQCTPCGIEPVNGAEENKVVTACTFENGVLKHTSCADNADIISDRCVEVEHCTKARKDHSGKCEKGYCYNNYFNIEGECKAGIPEACTEIENCEECYNLYMTNTSENVTQTQCKRCRKGYSLEANLEECVECKIELCDNCAGEDPDQTCTTCVSGFRVSAANATLCVLDTKSTEGIPFCLKKDKHERCVRCAPGFALTPTWGCQYAHGCKKLVAGVESALSCNDVEEDDNIFGGSDDVKVKFSRKWNPKCMEYDKVFLYCTACSDGYYLDQNLVCTKPIAPCITATGFTIPASGEGDGSLEAAIANVYKSFYALEEHCTKCVDESYYLVEGRCVPCEDKDHPHVKACTLTGDEYKVDECQPGYTQKDGECTSDDPSCSAYGDSGTCEKCAAGTGLLGGKCQSCQQAFGDSCKECDLVSQKCTKYDAPRPAGCDDFFVELLSNDPGCKLCSIAGDPGEVACKVLDECAECKPGYYMAESIHRCVPCTQFSPQCTACDATGCIACQGGFAPSADKQSCALCSTLFNNDETVCIACDAATCLVRQFLALSYDDNAIPHCMEFSGDMQQCLVCEQGYYVDLTVGTGNAGQCTRTQRGDEICAVAERQGATFGCKVCGDGREQYAMTSIDRVEKCRDCARGCITAGEAPGAGE